MFRRLTSLFFGGEEETPKDQRTPKSGDKEDEEWHLVSHQEAVIAMNTVKDQAAELTHTSVYRCPSNPPVTEENETCLETDVRMSEPELPIQRSSTPSRVIRGSVSQAGPLAKVTQMARVQRAQARSDRRHLARNCIQRQNSVRQRAQRHSSRFRATYLQQPGHRNFSH